MLRYGGISDRLKALFFDVVFIAIGMFIVTGIFSKLGEVKDIYRMFAFLCIVFLYEPLLVTIFGGTIGHFANKLRVKKATDPSKNINIFQAIIRFAIKSTVGIFSLLTIGASDKSQAIHDSLVNSVVIKRGDEEEDVASKTPGIDDAEILDQ